MVKNPKLEVPDSEVYYFNDDDNYEVVSKNDEEDQDDSPPDQNVDTQPDTIPTITTTKNQPEIQENQNLLVFGRFLFYLEIN